MDLQPDFIQTISNQTKLKKYVENREQKPRMIPLHRGQPLVFPDNGVLGPCCKPDASLATRLRVIDRSARFQLHTWPGPPLDMPTTHKPTGAATSMLLSAHRAHSYQFLLIRATSL
jgi:hypothetical protein